MGKLDEKSSLGLSLQSRCPQDVIYELLKGNRRFMNGCLINQSDNVHFVDLLMDDPYDPVQVLMVDSVMRVAFEASPLKLCLCLEHSMEM
eukprot:3232524-Amphidinium_carterae.1